MQETYWGVTAYPTYYIISIKILVLEIEIYGGLSVDSDMSKKLHLGASFTPQTPN